MKRTITKKELVDNVARAVREQPTKVRHVIQEFLDLILEALARGDRLEFREFGVFEVVRRKKRVGRNPKQAGVTIQIPEKNVVRFTPGKTMKQVVEREL